MKFTRQSAKFLGAALAVTMFAFACPTRVVAGDTSLDELLNRTSKQVTAFVDQFSSVKCTEHVTQES